MTKIEAFRQFLTDMEGLNTQLASLAREATEAMAARSALLRQGKTVGLTIMAVEQMLATLRFDYRPPEDVVTTALNAQRDFAERLDGEDGTGTGGAEASPPADAMFDDGLFGPISVPVSKESAPAAVAEATAKVVS